jgi:hypothetical protein
MQSSVRLNAQLDISTPIFYSPHNISGVVPVQEQMMIPVPDGINSCLCRVAVFLISMICVCHQRGNCPIIQ